MWGPRALSLSSGGFIRPNLSCKADSAASGSRQGPTQAKSTNTLAKAALTAGSLSLIADVLAQNIGNRQKKLPGGRKFNIDVWRSARMFGYGLLFYGPFQYKWYGALEKRFPSGGFNNFATKVLLNQVVLGPITVTVAFAWNLALTNHFSQFGGKLKRDMWPTMQTGWKFWVPAASINFAVVPLQLQVLYMSLCSVVWTAYISHASNTNSSIQTRAA